MPEPTAPPVYKRPASGLRTLADWFDQYDDRFPPPVSRHSGQVQKDLRAWADQIDAVYGMSHLKPEQAQEIDLDQFIRSRFITVEKSNDAITRAMKHEVLITVSGGLIESVHATDADTVVQVLDLDILDEDYQPTRAALEADRDTLGRWTQVYS
jgi:hypothetical protein